MRIAAVLLIMCHRWFAGALTGCLMLLAAVESYAQDARLIEDFEHLPDWHANNNTKLKSTSIYARNGQFSLRMAGEQGQWMGAQKLYDPGLDLSAMKSMEFWVFIQSSNPNFDGSYVPFAISLSSRTDFSSMFVNRAPTTNLRIGWNKVTLSKGDFTQAKSKAESWANPMVALKLWLAPIPNGKVTAFFDKLTINYGRPVVIFTFDDSLASTYSRAFPIMQAAGLKGVSYIIKNTIGTAGYMTIPQVDELYRAGWDIGNHTETHTFLENSDYDQCYRELKNCNDYIVANGWADNGRNLHFCCPGGRYNAALVQAMKDLGFRTGRCSIAGIQPQDVDNFLLLRAFYVGSLQQQPETTLAFIDRTVMANGCVLLMFHDITAGTPDRDPSNSAAAFQQIVSYVANLRQQGVLDVMTINEWYESVAKR